MSAPPLLDRLALLCALLAGLVALAWSLITPPFHVPDEPTHLAYVQKLAETGSPPEAGTSAPLSTELTRALSASRFSQVIGNERSRPAWPGEGERELRETLDADLDREDGGGPSSASSQPPLAYALGVVPYVLTRAAGGDVLDALQAVRLLSVLWSALTVFFVFAFVRALLPGTALAAPAGALAVAFQPMFGFVSSGVTPDALLFAVSAALLAVLARAFRFGLTARRAAAIGALVAAGLLTKLTFLGLVPGVALGALLLLLRAPREQILGALGAAAAAFAGPLVAYFAATRVGWGRTPFVGAGVEQVGAATTGRRATRAGTLSYFVQFYIPRPPFLQDLHPARWPAFDVWFRQLVGRFGWLDYAFPGRIVWLAALVWSILLVLAGRALVLGRAALRSRAPELLTYLVMLAGLIVVIAVPAYDYLVSTDFLFEQVRYLFPLLALYGGLVGLAVRGAGSRWGGAVAVSVVGLAALHTAAALLLTVSRYYG
jgi:4-amino-4-deoxy-L-arabinose transferase-like glycosyltransferase